MGVTFIAKEGTYTAPATLTTKTITENGTYSAVDDSANGYSSVVVNVEGGGGETWETVFEGSVTTEETPRGNLTQIEGYYISADNIKVTFNGTEYECPKISVESANIYGGFNESTQTPDFSEYPFSIMSSSEGGSMFFNIYTETAGTYTLKIEEPQSGGSSDFSTAEVTVQITTEDPGVYISIPAIVTSPMDMILNQQYNVLNSSTGQILTVPLYKGKLEVIGVSAGEISVDVSGSVEKVGELDFLITGDCTITIS